MAGKHARDRRRELMQAGIRPYGTEELRVYEQRLTRYFSREYRRLDTGVATLEELGISTREGPMWKATDELMSDHYDERPEFFRAFLDTRYMAYSMAYYGETPQQVAESDWSLEQAQQEKFDLICQRARVRGDERVFSIGCGFGPLETFLLQNYPGVEAVSITPSQVQAAHVRERMADPGHPLGSGRLELLEGDFSAVPPAQLGEQAYDLVFAVGVFEHVNNLYAAFERIAGLLRPGGRCFLHLIVSRPVFPKFMDSRNTLIGKYFPGGRIWPFHEFDRQTDFFSLEDSWYVNGMNYWRTLDEWHRRFWDNIDMLHEKVLGVEGIRHWNDYFTLCKVVLFGPLEGSVYGNGHYLLRKK